MTLLEPPENIVLALDPPLSGTMNPGDAMALWLVGETAVLESGRGSGHKVLHSRKNARTGAVTAR
ncbi:hypothetical protein PSH97_22295 [Pseudomonas cucumis]|uniref:Uncharacterized protein n=1 Tax=Pseudomonas cucumis TaxID=2954082 RepID=A0ABY9ETN1_9PSED|nr:hypothetical protein [Pseudomonas cucumis]WLG83799.1 hypothetical protein PSH97_22295 [Pseudomonas cucumis]